jgi:hypothetical protein
LIRQTSLSLSPWLIEENTTSHTNRTMTAMAMAMRIDQNYFVVFDDSVIFPWLSIFFCE